MKTRIIPINDFPFEQFNLLGMDKKAVLSLPPQTLEALQSGNRTSLIQFNNIRLKEDDKPFTINAKLSLELGDDDKPQLKVHPINLNVKNNLDLSQTEIVHLKKDPLNVVPKIVLSKQGELVDSFVSLDQTTNEFIAVKRDNIKAPEAINDVQLTDQQKRDFVNGKPIKIGQDNYQLDVNSEIGIAGAKFSSVTFKTGRYTPKNILLDFALIAAGMAPIVLIEHLAKMMVRNVAGNVYDNRQQLNALLNQDIKLPIKKTILELAEKVKTGMEIFPDEKNKLLVFNINEAILQKSSITSEKLTSEGEFQDFSKKSRGQEEGENDKAFGIESEKEDIKVKLNALKEFYESKGFFTDAERAQNNYLTEEFNSLGFQDKLASNDQTRTDYGENSIKR